MKKILSFILALSLLMSFTTVCFALDDNVEDINNEDVYNIIDFLGVDIEEDKPVGNQGSQNSGNQGNQNSGNNKVNDLNDVPGDYETEPLPVDFKTEISVCVITLSNTSYTYSGSEKKPSVSITYGKKALTKGTDYKVSYSNNINVGTGKVTIEGLNNFTGKVEKTFKIKAKSITPKVALSRNSYTYNGEVKNPSVTVYDGSAKLASSNYTVKYASGRKNVGSYKVTVTLKGNYSGSKSESFKINPKGTTVSKATSPKAKQIKVTWKKQKTQTYGYQIQVATDKEFTKNKKTVTINNNDTTSKIIKDGIKAKKKYYVRIRTYKTVDGEKYYSSWSEITNVKTK